MNVRPTPETTQWDDSSSSSTQPKQHTRHNDLNTCSETPQRVKSDDSSVIAFSINSNDKPEALQAFSTTARASIDDEAKGSTMVKIQGSRDALKQLFSRLPSDSVRSTATGAAYVPAYSSTAH